MIDSICRAQGYRTGLFTSPHLVTFRERIQVNGEMISEAGRRRGLTSIRDSHRRLGSASDFFRNHNRARACFISSNAKREIRRSRNRHGRTTRCDQCAATVVSVITPIDLDHQKWLGNTLTEIAGEKAGIIKAGNSGRLRTTVAGSRSSHSRARRRMRRAASIR